MVEDRRPWSASILSALVLIFAIMSLVSGLLLILDSTGAVLGLPSEYLDKVPFHSFIPVGLFLFVVYGIIPLFLAYGLWTREPLFMGEISKAGGIHWAWQGTWALLGVLAVWLIVEHLIGISLSPPTYFVIALGAVMFLLLVLPSTRKFYRAFPPA